jgi:DNA polymerase III alpha subunit
MTPLFKTHFSIGKSILTPKRCFELAKDLEEVVFVEDSFGGFRKIKVLSEKFDKPFRWGIRLNCSYADNKASKIILFAKDNKGMEDLREIYSRAQTKSGVWKYNKASLKNLLLCVPFYDSYVHKSLHHFGIYDLPLNDHIHLVEEHSHPYDYQIKRALDRLGVETQPAHTVLYEFDKHFEEFQFYKSVTHRKGGRPPNRGRPELDDCGSNLFSWQNYEKQIEKSRTDS